MLNQKWITKNSKTRLYQIPIPIIGLTGGIASGKSTIAEYFRKKNIPVIDADKLVRNIYLKPDTVNFIKQNFPEVMENNTIIFPRLRDLAFSNLQVKKKLEDFIYSYLPDEFKHTFLQLPSAEYVIYDVPLLFEKGLDHFVDASICVYIPRELQLTRLMKRDKINKLLAEKILEQQIDIEDKKKAANLVLNNAASIEQTYQNFEILFSELCG